MAFRPRRPTRPYQRIVELPILKKCSKVARGLTAEVQAARADWPLDHDGAERYNLL